MDEKDSETDALRDLVQHPGWRVLMRNTKERMDQFRAGFPFNVQDEKQLYFARGLMAALSSITSLEDQLDALEDTADESIEGE
jgi:hypothetical protein